MVDEAAPAVMAAQYGSEQLASVPRHEAGSRIPAEVLRDAFPRVV